MIDELRDKTVLSFIALLVILIACNLAFAYSNGWARWGWQLFGFAGLVSVYIFSGLSLADIGLSKGRLGVGLKYALVSILAILFVLLLVFFIKQSVFNDNRYHQALRAAIAAGVFIVPIKIVLFEELAFRGIMPALLKNIGGSPWLILIITSVLFGLWHITTAPKTGNVSVGNFPNLYIVGAVFLATTVAGAALYFLRYQSDSLVPAIAVHWFINGSAIVLAALSWR